MKGYYLVSGISFKDAFRLPERLKYKQVTLFEKFPDMAKGETVGGSLPGNDFLLREGLKKKNFFPPHLLRRCRVS
jgi:hypothetical protein